jgi:hypothetical protein
MGMIDKRLIFFIAAIILFLAFVIIFWNYSIDDAFVTFRYAENLAAGHGLTFNPGDKPVEGYSNFLWLIILAVLHLLGLSTYMAAKVLGILFFLLTGILWWRYTKKSDGPYEWLIPVLFLAMPITAFWGVSGLELGLYSFLVAGAVISILAGSYWTILFLPLIVFSRPEGFIIALAAIVIDWFFVRREKTANKSKILIDLMVTIAAIFTLISFRLYYFGYSMPNTFYVKSGAGIAGFTRLAKMLLFIAPLALLFAVRLWMIIRTRLINKKLALFAGLFILQAFISSLAIPIMNFHLRYLIPFVPLFFIVALSVIDFIKNERWRSAILIVSILSIFIPLIAINDSVRTEKRIMESQHNLIKWLNTIEGRKRISMTDMGRIPYYTKMNYNDLWGLLSEDIAHKGFDAITEFSRFPDYFIFVGDLEGEKVNLRFGKERYIYNLRHQSAPIFNRFYSLFASASPEGISPKTPDYHYLVFELNRAAADSLKAGLISP